tara:strand:- start:3196 stop:4182 length:987 start_codon:yes stop_codon:yes gene_type:complete
MSQTSAPQLDLRGWVLLISLALIWAGAFYFTEIALEGYRPFTLVLGRVGVAAVALFAWISLRGKRLPASPGIWGAFLVMGALNNLLPFSLIVWGQTLIEAGVASILNATTPIFAVLLAHFLTANERLSPRRFLGVLLGFFGVVVLLAGPRLLDVGGRDLGGGVTSGLPRIGASTLDGWLFLLAHLAVLGAAFSYASASIFGRRFHRLDTEVAACGMLVASTSLALPLAFLIESPLSSRPGLIASLAVVATGLLGTAVAYLIYFSLLRRAGSTNTMLVTFLIPPGALLLGIFLLDEKPAVTAWIGMGLIFLGLLVIDGRLFRRRRLAGA